MDLYTYFAIAALVTFTMAVWGALLIEGKIDPRNQKLAKEMLLPVIYILVISFMTGLLWPIGVLALIVGRIIVVILQYRAKRPAKATDPGAYEVLVLAEAARILEELKKAPGDLPAAELEVEAARRAVVSLWKQGVRP